MPVAPHRMLFRGQPSESYSFKSMNEPSQRPMENGSLWPFPSKWLLTFCTICIEHYGLNTTVQTRALVRKLEFLHVLVRSCWLGLLHLTCPLWLGFLRILCPLWSHGQPPSYCSHQKLPFCVLAYVAVHVLSHLCVTCGASEKQDF